MKTCRPREATLPEYWISIPVSSVVAGIEAPFAGAGGGVIHYSDLHTEGEPTRVITAGFPDLGDGSISERCQKLQHNFSDLCSGIVREPRGHEAMVAALLLKPADPRCDHGVIFFNNVGPLGMCGHGTMGVVRALKDLGKLKSDRVTLETPAGIVEATIEDDGRIAVLNVESYCYRLDVEIELSPGELVTGDIAWGGNWFFIADSNRLPLNLTGLPKLIDYTSRIRKALESAGITGAGGALIDHIELHGELERYEGETRGARSFVLCPGMEWDRSPCGTGTSATVATQVHRGILQSGDHWIQESILGGYFEASWVSGKNGIVPKVLGRAWPCAQGELIFEKDDPFRHGFPS